MLGALCDQWALNAGFDPELLQDKAGGWRALHHDGCRTAASLSEPVLGVAIAWTPEPENAAWDDSLASV
ncbi:hypothetical protein [Salinisphaera sp. LB1]|uniref:hypothetical protein n=1 Tax=Salinisphaera sp. LB1 TaxID=2183911 RepID=UPI000D705313|nr:hypothetical protein [Salinisphaera sp. LB1]AWN16721.1 hypothetical protein SALB1_2523 [Salinisphaera sp. LB1]